MITLTTLDGTEFDIQPSTVITAREPLSSEDTDAEAVMVYHNPADNKPFKEIAVQETIFEIADQDTTLFVTEDLTPDNEVIVCVRNQNRVIGVVDNSADNVQYRYNDERFEETIRTHNGDYDSFISDYDGDYSPSPSPSPSPS